MKRLLLSIVVLIAAGTACGKHSKNDPNRLDKPQNGSAADISAPNGGGSASSTSPPLGSTTR